MRDGMQWTRRSNYLMWDKLLIKSFYTTTKIVNRVLNLMRDPKENLHFDPSRCEFEQLGDSTY